MCRRKIKKVALSKITYDSVENSERVEKFSQTSEIANIKPEESIRDFWVRYSFLKPSKRIKKLRYELQKRGFKVHEPKKVPFTTYVSFTYETAMSSFKKNLVLNLNTRS